MSSERLVQFIGVVSLSLSLSVSLFLSVSFTFSLYPAGTFPSSFPSRRGGFRGAIGEGYPGGFCPSFVSSSNYDLPHEYEPYVNIRALPPLPSPVRPIPSFRLLFLPLSFSFFVFFSFFLSLPVSFSPRYRGADVISCSVGLQMHPR